ncbi:beta-glucosidase [Bacillus sp. FJAT-18017]|uniref:GH1 family beta-glucosidase n=1 Tax=Bacillus sp. FJAT-18017 TaxID=1705566 RepID=UPI0006B02135|nr:GH1 family beta-glucosidase [Bacillus sp. FJAT-18017]ALC91380.1 beta-glucosidase [Bacillus sp. FJAT-18017]
MPTITFPKDFKWGTATAAYQIEGAAFEDGRGLSIWDTFSHTPGKVKNGDNGDIACDSYHRYEEDIELLADLGARVYRFSVSWPRIYPNGKGDLNPKGLNYYHNLINKLLEKGIEPMLTLYHWDLPQALQGLGGWANRDTVEAFSQYAETVFKEFNGKVKFWQPINEPFCAAFLSNYHGVHAPGFQDLQLAVDVSHHLVLAHGRAVQIFREMGIEGKIGTATNTTWREPYSNRPEDREACRREIGINIDWFLDPILKGHYPDYMVEWFKKKGAELRIADGDMEVIHQPIDFIGVNYYSGNIARYKENSGLLDIENIEIDYQHTHIGWPIYADGLNKVFHYLTDRYGTIPLFITENGACCIDELVNGEVEDQDRIHYYQQHLTAVSRAIESGIPIIGYLAWSLMDNFEWAEGYGKRFGLVYVDFNTRERKRKNSFSWYKNVIANGWMEI